MKKVFVPGSVFLLMFVLLVAPSLAAQGDASSASQQSSQGGGQAALGGNFMMSDLMDKTIVNPQGEQLGTVENVIVAADGRVSYLILSPSRGIKGSNEIVAVPWSAASPRLQKDTISVNLSRNQLQNAPAIPRSDLAQLQNPQMQQRVNAYFGATGMQQGVTQPGELQGGTRGYYDGGTQEPFESGQEEQQGLDQGSQGQRQPQSGVQGGSMGQGSSQGGIGSSGIRANFRARTLAAQSPQSSPGGVSQFRLNNVRVEQLIGEPVLNQQGLQLGTIDDFVLDQSGQIRYLILSRAQGAGYTGELTAIPWSAARPTFRANQMYVNITQQRLANAPHFNRNQFSQLYTPQFRQRIFSYYGAEPMTGAFGMGGFRANAVIGETIRNTQGQELGTVRDLFTNENGCIKYAVIAPAESLQMRDKLVAIPWNMVQGNIQEGTFVANIALDRLQNAPSFSRENWRNYINNPQFDQQVNTYFGAIPQQDAFLGRQSPYGAFGMLRASQLMGNTVASSRGETLGSLEDLITDNSGRIKYLLIAPEETMEMANQLVAVPWDAATPQLRQNQIIVNISQVRFSNAPSLARGNLQQLNDPQWERDVRAYFGTPQGYEQWVPEMQQRFPQRGQGMQQDFPESRGMQRNYPEEMEQGGIGGPEQY